MVTHFVPKPRPNSIRITKTIPLKTLCRHKKVKILALWHSDSALPKVLKHSARYFSLSLSIYIYIEREREKYLALCFSTFGKALSECQSANIFTFLWRHSVFSGIVFVILIEFGRGFGTKCVTIFGFRKFLLLNLTLKEKKLFHKRSA